MLQHRSVAIESFVPPETKALMFERIRGEFREMPGLTLTVAQAARLWSIEPTACTQLLNELVDSGYLCRKPDGTYGRTSDLSAHPLRMAKAGMEFLTAPRPRRATAEG